MEQVNESQIMQMSEETCEAFERLNVACEEAARHFERLFGTLKEHVRIEIAKRFVFLADKFSNASIFTRWYWKRKMKNFVKGLSVLEEL